MGKEEQKHSLSLLYTVLGTAGYSKTRPPPTPPPISPPAKGRNKTDGRIEFPNESGPN